MTPAERVAKAKMNHREPSNAKSVRNVVWVCRLREKRRALRLSLDDVAEAVGVSKTALHQIEHGTDPMLTTARRLAGFFGCAVEDLWTAIRPPLAGKKT